MLLMFFTTVTFLEICRGARRRQHPLTINSAATTNCNSLGSIEFYGGGTPRFDAQLDSVSSKIASATPFIVFVFSLATFEVSGLLLVKGIKVSRLGLDRRILSIFTLIHIDILSALIGRRCL